MAFQKMAAHVHHVREPRNQIPIDQDVEFAWLDTLALLQIAQRSAKSAKSRMPIELNVMLVVLEKCPRMVKLVTSVEMVTNRMTLVERVKFVAAMRLELLVCAAQRVLLGNRGIWHAQLALLVLI